jgi:phosphate acetyltransferase
MAWIAERSAAPSGRWRSSRMAGHEEDPGRGRNGHLEMQATLDAAALCKMAERGQITGGLLDGPLAFDNAIGREAARIEGIASAVAGDPDILVAPDLESGNMLAKQLSFLANADSAWLVVGARVPIILTSRADSVRSRIASGAVAMLAAHARRRPLQATT